MGYYDIRCGGLSSFLPNIILKNQRADAIINSKHISLNFKAFCHLIFLISFQKSMLLNPFLLISGSSEKKFFSALFVLTLLHFKEVVLMAKNRNRNSCCK